MAARYNASYAGIGEMLVAPWMVAAMHARAEKVKAAAEADAPVARRGKHRGRYKASFEVESGVREAPDRRAFGRVVNTSPESFYVEFGTSDTPKHRTLGRALSAARG